jgi:hypothetical protein
MTFLRPSRRLAGLRCPAAVVALMLAATNTVLAQGFGEEVPTPQVTRILELNNVRPETVQETFANLFGDVRTAVDRNRLIMRGTDEQLKMIEALAQELDRPVESDLRTITLNLGDFPGGGDSASEVARFASGNSNLNFYQDAVAEVLLVSGKPDDLAKFERTMAEVNERLATAMSERKAAAADEKSKQQFLVRLTWLVALPGQDEKAASMSNVPDDLKGVAAELVNVGMAAKPEEIRLGTQLLVAATDGTFRMQGRERLLGESKASLGIELEGVLSSSPGGGHSKHLHIDHFRVARLGGGPSGEDVTLCTLSSSVTAPLGQSIVLGMAPTGEMTSAAVIQIRPLIKADGFNSAVGESR